MKIAIDASRATRAQRTGTENYALRLLQAVLALNATRPVPNTLVLYFRDQPTPGLFDPALAAQQVIPFRRLWTHVRFAAAIFRDRPVLTFVPAHTLPLLFPGSGVVTIHDLGYIHFPEAHSRRQRWILDWTTRYSARRASLILADSVATKRDLVTAYNINPDKIRVVYPGVEGISRASDTEIATVRAKHKLPERYWLFVGTIQPRKNIARLIAAYQQWRAQANETDRAIPLVLAGRRGWLSETLPLDAPGVILPGYIDDADIASLYSGALALTFPSLYEGFGFPVIEAMRCGTPVLCSSTSSLPELADDAALMVDPLAVDAICAGLARLAADSALRADLTVRGYRQALQFSWSAAAEQTLTALENVANGDQNH
jgi:glycosyltransferase involved in cell wall biosynthesis